MQIEGGAHPFPPPPGLVPEETYRVYFLIYTKTEVTPQLHKHSPLCAPPTLIWGGGHPPQLSFISNFGGEKGGVWPFRYLNAFYFIFMGYLLCAEAGGRDTEKPPCAQAAAESPPCPPNPFPPASFWGAMGGFWPGAPRDVAHWPVWYREAGLFTARPWGGERVGGRGGSGAPPKCLGGGGGGRGLFFFFVSVLLIIFLEILLRFDFTDSKRKPGLKSQ